MRKFAGVLLMSIMLALAACGGGGTQVTKTYTYLDSGKNITIPSNVGNLTLLSGQGAAGYPESEYYVEAYSKNTKTYNQRNDQGGVILTFDQGTTYHDGPTPSDYCGPLAPYGDTNNPNYTQTCYYHADASYWQTDPATTGAASTMTGPNNFSRTFPGGYAGPAPLTAVENVAVTPGGQYMLTIPYGGSITISYFQ